MGGIISVQNAQWRVGAAGDSQKLASDPVGTVTFSKISFSALQTGAQTVFSTFWGFPQPAPWFSILLAEDCLDILYPCLKERKERNQQPLGEDRVGWG